MNKTSLTILALCLPLIATAEPIGKQAALYTAKAYMQAKGKTFDAVQKPFSAPRKATAGQTEQAAAPYYIFNAGGDNGYVIVSGDDRVEPILGYVEEGTFDPDNIPENMRSWLQQYADEINYIIDNNIQPVDPMLQRRNKVAGTRHSIPELLKSRWNQGHPYNITCPKYYKGDGTQAYSASGCSATALAQVMNFHKFPARLKAPIPTHSNNYKLDDGTTKTVNFPAIPRNTPIDWDNMCDTYSWPDGHVANAQDSAVANLMFYCGQAIKMGWGASSGAVTSRSRDALVNYFGYDSRTYWGSRTSYSIDEWFNLLYDELESGYPILYSGQSSSGGHAFVIDGFDGENLFHVNWGWGGGSNGWFLISILNPGDNSGIGASSSSDGYSMSNGALFNLRVPGTPKEDKYLSVSDVTLTSTSVKAKLTNRTGSTGNFNAGIVMQEEDGSLKLVGNKLTLTSLPNGSSSTKNFLLKDKLPEGTYKLSVATKPMKSENWKAEYDFINQYIVAVVDSTGEINMQMFKPIPVGESISIDTIVFPGTRIQKKEQEVKVTFRNEGKEYIKTIYFFASQTQTKVYTESRSTVAIRVGETTEVSYFFTPDTIGTYNLWFCTDDKGNNVVGQGTVDIISEAQAEKADLSVNSYVITNQVSNVAYGKRLVGKARIKNNKSEDFHGQIKLQVWSQKGGSGSAWSGASKKYEVDVMAGKVADVDFEFGGLSEDYKYYISASYVNQDGQLRNGGVWDLGGWFVRAGFAAWKPDGTILGKAYTTTFSSLPTYCGVYIDCSRKVNRLRPNVRNPNTIFAFNGDMELPLGADTTNTVSGSHANRICLESGYPYYIPVSFDADTASFAYTFPADEDGTRWHAFTMPFRPDSIFIDDELVSLTDSTNHFWIYEFSGEKANGVLGFKQATSLRGSTPYIIAADKSLAGRTIVFRSFDVPFYQFGTDKMLVSSQSFRFHGNTFAPRLKDCYVLNADGTAFDYTTKALELDPMAPYFTTVLSEDVMPQSIILPPIPVKPVLVGDLNGDLVVDIADAVSVLNIMSEGAESADADVNGDGVVDIADFVSILNIMAQE